MRTRTPFSSPVATLESTSDAFAPFSSRISTDASSSSTVPLEKVETSARTLFMASPVMYSMRTAACTPMSAVTQLGPERRGSFFQAILASVGSLGSTFLKLPCTYSTFALQIRPSSPLRTRSRASFTMALPV